MVIRIKWKSRYKRIIQKWWLKSTLDNISLFGVDITLKTNEMVMYNCSIKEIIGKDKNKKVKFESSHIEFILTNNEWLLILGGIFLNKYSIYC